MPAPPLRSFAPNSPDRSEVISWVHIGDLHRTARSEQNFHDPNSIVDQVNRAFADSIAFVFLPGDVAEHGSAAEYTLAREALDQLKSPWCSIVGDHDVHEKSFSSFLDFMAPATRFSFQIGQLRFIALNAFDIADPRSFAFFPEQLDWLQQQLHHAGQHSASALLLHCDPSELRQGADRLRELIEAPVGRLVEMGHDVPVRSTVAKLAGRILPLSRIAESNVWQDSLDAVGLLDGVHPLSVSVEDSSGRSATDSIRIVLGSSAYRPPERSGRDQDNAVDPCPECGLLGTQLGPNKNGRKW